VEPGWPQTIGRQPWSTAAIGDVDDVPGLEIFVSSGASTGVHQGVLYGCRHDGTEIVDGDANAATNGVFYRSTSANARFMYGSPAVADIDADGRDEIVLLEKTKHTAPSHATLYVFDGDGTVLPGFPYDDPASLGSTSSPAVADLDGDGRDEIVAITENRIFVVNHDGTNLPGWPKTLPPISSTSTEIRDFLTSPAIGDVDGDGELDVAFGWLNGDVHLYTGATGVAHPGFPKHVFDADSEFDEYLRSPILGNLDGDPEPEVILATGDNRLLVVNADGSVLPGFPLLLPGIVYGAAAVYDVDGDGFTNLLVQTDAPVMSVFEFPSVPWVASENPWPMFRHDVLKTGNHSASIAVDVGEVAPVTAIATRTHPPRPNPFSAGRVELPFDVAGDSERVRVRVFDVGGREVRVLANGVFPGGRFRLSWDGRRATGVELPAGTYFVRTEIGSRVFAEKVTILR
jgi:hypothetical protein